MPTFSRPRFWVKGRRPTHTSSTSQLRVSALPPAAASTLTHTHTHTHTHTLTHTHTHTHRHTHTHTDSALSDRLASASAHRLLFRTAFQVQFKDCKAKHGVFQCKTFFV